MIRNALLAAAVAFTPVADASVVIERPGDTICYRLDPDMICVRDVAEPNSANFTRNKGKAADEKWENVHKSKLGGKTLRRDSLGDDNFADPKGFARALAVLVDAATPADQKVVIEKPAGKLCYVFEGKSLCIADIDEPRGVSYTLNKGAKPETWAFLAKEKLDGKPIRRDSIAGHKLTDPAGFRDAVRFITTRAALKTGGIMEKLQQDERIRPS